MSGLIILDCLGGPSIIMRVIRIRMLSQRRKCDDGSGGQRDLKMFTVSLEEGGKGHVQCV